MAAQEDSGKAPTSTRTMWKGAISFGLVHIPVGLYSATASSGIDFDWLDKRSMEPVGYKRVNKVTGKEIAASDIVKGVEYEDGRYVVLSPEEIAAAFPKTTQTIEIEAFLDADEIPFVYLERPYYTAPLKRGEKVYALLREALRRSHKVGVAKVVIQTKQHLAVLIPCGRALVLNLLRWGGEIRSFEQLNLPPMDAKAAGIKEGELNMALQLIEDMTQRWDADQFRNSFADEIHKLIEAKAEAGDIEDVVKVERESSAPAGAEVLDLSALLKRSLQGGRKTAEPDEAPSASARKKSASVTALPSAKRAASRAAPAKKGAAKKSRAAARKTGAPAKAAAKRPPARKSPGGSARRAA
ncbi:Ku protein [Xenophilus sp. Marseille-Q4582]|uniref:non-homologous end joining protein Ku n=1 Tax=Xenophilus sp. Marseille-Q4582 TaxID=2866600 RepID=UPI001CE47065|nr:Ku protein [Xenophilus sp. Marseille-Q4582]